MERKSETSNRSIRLADSERPKPLSLFSLIALVVANMIGAGVFTTSGFALADLGSPNLVMLAWVLGGIIAMCGALSYGALSKQISESGGEYLFLSRVIHPMAGFIAGWVSLIAGFSGAIALSALAFETYFGSLLPFRIPSGALAVTVILIAAILHGANVKLGTGLQDLIVLLKFVLILIFLGVVVVGLRSSVSEINMPNPPTFSTTIFGMTMVWISLSFSGYNAAVYIAGEAQEKHRLVPKAMWMGTLLVTLIYLALNAAFMYLVPAEITAGKGDVAVAAATYLGGDNLAKLVRSLVGISLISSVFAMIMIGPRVYAKMADDGLFPKFLQFQGDVPRASIAFQAGASILFICFTSLKNLLSYLGFTLSICAALTVFCLFLIKRRDTDGAVKIPGYPFIPGLFVLATIVLAVFGLWRNPFELLFALLTFIVGVFLYFLVQSLSARGST